MAYDPLKILIVDDSVVYRRILREVVESFRECEVVGIAAHGKLALTKIEQIPVEFVLLDVEMPVMNGLETMERIQRRYPDIGVVMVSGINHDAADITMQALEHGALDFITKPGLATPEQNRDELIRQLGGLIKQFNIRRNLRKIRESGKIILNKVQSVRESGKITLETARRITKSKPPTPIPKPATIAPTASRQRLTFAPLPQKLDVIGIGISTGGPNALVELIPKFPENLGVPVLIVQHMPPLFTASLAKSLDYKSKVKVVEAEEDSPILPNTVYLAPGGKHMTIRKNHENGHREFLIGLNENPPENSCRPSVDVLFRSMAVHYGGNVLATIMTGMGSDGLHGVQALKKKGCYCLTQNEETCVVYGMPLAIDQAGLSDESLPLGKLADRITQLVRHPGDVP